MRIDRIDRVGNRLRVHWYNGESTDFHYTWLRDWCPCVECEKRYVMGSTAEWFVAPDIEPLSARITASGLLELTWPPDNHVSVFEPDWLAETRAELSTRDQSRNRAVLWGSELNDGLPVMDCSEVDAAEDQQLRLLQLVQDYGFVLVRNVPTNPGEVECFAGLLGYEIGGRRNWGRADDVVAKSGADNAVYVPRAMRPHTDYAYAAWPPGLFVFHCLKSSPDGGGCSLLVDGFCIAETMRRDAPDAFSLLTRMPLRFRGEGSFIDDWRAEGCVFTLDQRGQVVGVRFNADNLLPISAPEESLDTVYHAIHDLIQRISAPENQVRLFLVPGDCLVIDNHRVLHGRTAFKGTKSGRHLQSVYIERDEVRTRIRILARRSNKSNRIDLLSLGARG